jgi:hypothetical protein
VQLAAELLEWNELDVEHVGPELLEPQLLVGRPVDAELLEQQHVRPELVVLRELGLMTR